MKDYVLNDKPESVLNDTVWAFDLGKGSIGEAVRRGTSFLHKASLLIPAEFAETKTARDRRRMHRTREAHKAREAWLRKVMQEGGVEILKGRQICKMDEQGNEISKEKWKKTKGEWKTINGDYRLEREFPPREFQRNKDGKIEPVVYPGGKAKDGAPAMTAEDFSICYNSALLRIKLLRGNRDLKEWQIFKALHAAIQKRGYERVPWAAQEAGRQGVTLAEFEQKEREELAKKEPKYRATLTAWNNFVQVVLNEHGLSHEKFAFPCFYDAWKMGLWKPEKPDDFSIVNLKHEAQSTRNIRFDRKDLEREILLLTANADKFLNGKLERVRIVLLDKFKREKLERVNQINQRRDAKNATLPPEKRKKKHLEPPSFEHMAASAGEFLLFGPAGQPSEDTKNDFSKYLAFRRQAGLRPGSEDDWKSALGQKIPRFDNRIVEQCALILRLASMADSQHSTARASGGKAKQRPTK